MAEGFRFYDLRAGRGSRDIDLLFPGWSPGDERVLVLSPHDDDALLGAGYALAAAAMLLIGTGASFLVLNGLRAFVAPHSAQQEADARVASVVWDGPDDEAPPKPLPAFPLLAHLDRIEEAQFRSPYTAQ